MEWMAHKTSDTVLTARAAGPKRGIVWILAGLVLTGLVAGYSWLRRLPK